MLLDKQLTFSDQQSLAVAPGAVISTNTVDLRPTATAAVNVAPGATTGVLGAPINDIAKGNTLELLVQITEAFASGGAGTLRVEAISSDKADLTDATGTITTRADTGVMALATLTLGRQLNLTLPTGITQRYLGLRYTIATAAMTAGKVTAGFIVDRQSNYA